MEENIDCEIRELLDKISSRMRRDRVYRFTGRSWLSWSYDWRAVVNG